MSKNEIIKKFNSKYILAQVFSFLQLNVYYKIIKYNKKLQQRLNINIEDSIFNYNYSFSIKTKNEIESDIKEMQKMLNSIPFEKSLGMRYASFSSKFCLKYSYPLEVNLNEIDKEVIFLTKYKGFKIDYFPIFLIANTLSYIEKIKIFENNDYFFKYTLNSENIELINIINELRKKNKINNLIYYKRQNLDDFFKLHNSSNEKYLFIYPKGEFKNKILNNDEKINKLILKENLKYIIILEKEKNEYILVYENSKGKNNINIINENILEKNKLQNFHIINNTVPEIIINHLIKNKKHIIINLNANSCNNNPGYQILSFKNDILIGLLEGPPNSPYENGYFLFKLLISSEFPIVHPDFCFLTNIFHPNISVNGYVSVDFLNFTWAPALCNFEKIIYSIQSLLDDPNPDNFLNETAANLYKKDRKGYNETIREYTNKFANYSRLLEDIKNMDIKIKILKKGEKFKLLNENKK